MNTQLLVREVNSLIDFINDNCTGIIFESYRDEDGYMDYDGAEIEVDQIEMSISALLDEATNPYLPCLTRLREAAQNGGYRVYQHYAPEAA